MAKMVELSAKIASKPLITWVICMEVVLIKCAIPVLLLRAKSPKGNFKK